MISTCLHHATDIFRRFEPREWPAQLDRIPPECREECREHLAGLGARLRVIRRLKADALANGRPWPPPRRK